MPRKLLSALRVENSATYRAHGADPAPPVPHDFRLFMAYRPALYARSHDIPRALYRLSPHQVRIVRDRHFRPHRLVAPQALPASTVNAGSGGLVFRRTVLLESVCAHSLVLLIASSHAAV